VLASFAVAALVGASVSSALGPVAIMGPVLLGLVAFRVAA
jgi:hypothetical protein